jgi:hypothetical protein
MIRRKYLKTEQMKIIVLDEADEMLSQGFKDQIYKIFQYMPSTIQIGLFSATMPPECEALSEKFMDKPSKILVKADALTLQGIAQRRLLFIVIALEGLTISTRLWLLMSIQWQRFMEKWTKLIERKQINNSELDNTGF